MMHITDEMLMKYADGELETAEVTMVEEALENDPELREKVSRHHALRTELGLAFQTIDDKPMPDSIIELLKEDDAKVVSITTKRETSNKTWWQPMAIAASLVGAFAIGMFSGGLIPTQNDYLMVKGEVAQLLDSTPAGTSINDLVILDSFLSAEGNFCRTYQDSSTSSTMDVLSCRITERKWKIITLVPGVPVNAYVPAAGEVESIIHIMTDKMQKLSIAEEKKHLNH